MLDAETCGHISVFERNFKRQATWKWPGIRGFGVGRRCRGWPQERERSWETVRVWQSLQKESGPLKPHLSPLTATVTHVLSCCIYTVLLYYTCKTIQDCMRPRNRGSIPSRSKKFFYCRKLSDRLWGPNNFLFNGYWELFPRGGGVVKRTGREADHSPPSSAEVENEWSYTSTAPYLFLASKGTWECHIYCTGFSEKCENSHNDVSDWISVTILLFRHL
jgi:hypothetical protein